MKDCPSCGKPLKSVKMGSVEVDECASCKGIWFEQNELRQAKDEADPDLNWMDFGLWQHAKEFASKPSSLSCPSCSIPLVSLKYGDSAVCVEICPSCKGTWLEKGEFKKILDSMEKELVSKSLSEYVHDAVKEGGELLTGHESFISEWKDFTTVLRLMEYRLFVENPTLLNTVTSTQNTVH